MLKGSVHKPLLLSMALMLLQQFSGINSYFTVFIFQKAGSTIKKNLATIVRARYLNKIYFFNYHKCINADRRYCTTPSYNCFYVFGRPGWSPSSSSHLWYFHVDCPGSSRNFLLLRLLETYGAEIQKTLGWLPLASLLLFIIAYSSGFANVHFLIIGELFPTKFRYCINL